MRTRIFMALALGTAVAGSASAQNAPRNSFSIQPGSQLSVEGTSSVRGWTCQAEKIDGAVLADDAVLSIQRAPSVTRASLAVDVAALECGNGTMNSHMRKALKDQAAPRITFSFSRLEAGSAGSVRVTGDLSMAGQTRPVTLQGQLTEEPGGGLRFKGSHEFNMTVFGMEPPRLMAGTLKVHDPVKVSFDVLFRQ
jgi:polyisoprenoid-binding protein YceI